MNKISIVLNIVAAILLTMILSSCSGDTSNSATGNTSINVSFQKTSGKVLAAATLQELNITRLTLDVIPLNTPAAGSQQVDLFAIHQQTNTYSHTINNLLDNETYLFRIIAYNAQDDMIYCGQTSLLLLPNTANVVNLTAYSFSGFLPLEGQYDWTSSDGASAVIALTMTGEGTGAGATFNLSAYLAPAQTGYSVIMSRTPAIAGVSRVYSGTLDAGSGNGSGTGLDPNGQPVTWTMAKPPAQAFP